MAGTQQLQILIFTYSSLCWDTIHAGILITKAAKIPIARHIRRNLKKKHRTLRAYPYKWIILSQIMIHSSRLLHPAQDCMNSIMSTHQRMIQLHNLITFTPSVFVQYNGYQAMNTLQLFPELISKASKTYDDFIFSDTLDDIKYEGNHLCPTPKAKFMNRDISCQDSELHFFDTHSSYQSLNDFYNSIDFCTPRSSPQQPPFLSNWLDIDGLQQNQYVNCCYHNDDTPTIQNCPSPNAYVALERGGIPMSFDDTTSPSESSFPVIFDSGASLAISPNKGDFVGPIETLSNLKLGGMANGMIIEGKGIVEWTFSGKENKRLTVKTLCYYVPDCKARLISPQRLFNKDKGVSGKFVVEQTQATLKFDGLSPLEIDYDSRNWLPIATCRNIQGNPSLNLTITNDNNQNLSPSKRRLLN